MHILLDCSLTHSQGGKEDDDNGGIVVFKKKNCDARIFWIAYLLTKHNFQQENTHRFQLFSQLISVNTCTHVPEYFHFLLRFLHKILQMSVVKGRKWFQGAWVFM